MDAMTESPQFSSDWTPRGTLSLDVALNYSGLSEERFRAWEPLHGLQPAWHSSGGDPFYTIEQAEALLKLRLANEAGIGEHALRSLHPMELDQFVRSNQLDMPLDPIFGMAKEFDWSRIEHLLRLRLEAQGIRGWIFKTVLPLLSQAGDRWSDDQLTVAQEHVISVAVRQSLMAVLDKLAIMDGRQRAIVTTLSGEQHEFGAILATILARLCGVEAHYLGADLPFWEIVRAAEAARTGFVLVSVVSITRADAIRQLLRLRAELPRSIRLVAGGPSATLTGAGPEIITLDCLDALEATLTTL